jgi:Flp pilus assembly protein TadD
MDKPPGRTYIRKDISLNPLYKVSFMLNLFRTPTLFALALMILTSFPARSEQTSASSASSEDMVKTEDILALNSTMRSMLDTFVMPLKGKEKRAQALYDLMFGVDKFALKYDNGLTKTAIETVASGSGNCVSLANAFVAMARYVDLNANFLDVKVPESWKREGDVYYQLKHVSASVKISHSNYLGIEYLGMGSISSSRPKLVDDVSAFAVFYSNRGIELLMQGKMEAAIAHLKQAVKLDPDSANNWSNLGVAYRRLDRMEEAEGAYLQALKQDKSDLTTLSNLAILYQMTGRQNLADKYSKKLEHYRRQNPYYLIDLAKDEMKAGNYKQALEDAESAIDKYDDEHEFYFVAAQIYAHLGNTEKARENLKNAERYALSVTARNMYSRKLEMLGER